VRELQPVYNRRLRGAGETWTWLIDDVGGAPKLHELAGPVPQQADAFGLYRSVRQAKTALTQLARDHKLCLRVLGLESAGKGSCFAYQVGRCAGACVGEEPLARHGLRVKLLLAPIKLRSWPHAGAVAIEETSALGMRHWHVVEGWQYLGTLVADEHEEGRGAQSLRDAPAQGFDADTYRILCRYLKPNARNLRPWPKR